MTGGPTLYEQRVAECAARDHRWESWPVTVCDLLLLLFVCGNCGVTPKHSHEYVEAALAAPLSADC